MSSIGRLHDVQIEKEGYALCKSHKEKRRGRWHPEALLKLSASALQRGKEGSAQVEDFDDASVSVITPMK